MTAVRELRPSEEPRLDHARIVEIGCSMGPAAADDFICQTMEEIAVLLSEAERAYESGRFVALRAASQQIARHSAGIGMSTLERAATNLSAASTRAGSASLAAVTDRMLRAGEQSFVALWQLGDASM